MDLTRLTSNVIDLRVHRVDGLTLGDHAYRPDVKMRWHRHEYDHFYIVLEGSCLEGNRYSGRMGCAPAAVVFHPAGELHETYCTGDGTRLFGVELEPRWLERVREHIPLPTGPYILEGGPVSWIMRRLHAELEAIDPVSPLAIEALTLELLSAVARQKTGLFPGNAPKWLEGVRERLWVGFDEPPGLGQLAELARAHPVYLARIFRQHYGCSIGEYVRRRRIEYSREQLVKSEIPLSEIALQAGFCDQAHFTRLFKRITGETPAGFRKRHRAG